MCVLFQSIKWKNWSSFLLFVNVSVYKKLFIITSVNFKAVTVILTLDLFLYGYLHVHHVQKIVQFTKLLENVPPILASLLSADVIEMSQCLERVNIK